MLAWRSWGPGSTKRSSPRACGRSSTHLDERLAARAARAPQRRGARSHRLAPEPADRAGARRRQRRRPRRRRHRGRPCSSSPRLGELVDHRSAGELPVDPAQVLHAILQRNPDGTPAADRASRSSRCSTPRCSPTRPASRRLWSQLRSEIDSADAHRRRHGVHPSQRHRAAARRAAPPLRSRASRCGSSPPPTPARPSAGPSTSSPTSAPTSASPTTSAAPASTPRPGCSTGARASRPPTSARRTSRTRRRSRAWSGTSGPRPPATPTSSTSSSAVFDSYWEAGDFVPYDADAVRRGAGPQPAEPTAARTSSSARSSCGPMPFQERLLEQIDVAREQGHHRNLLVAATGTGKTVMAARRLRPPPPAPPPRPAAVRRPPRGDPRPEPRHVPLRAAGRRPSARSGSAAPRPTAVRARVRVDPEPQRQRPRRPRRPITSTW